MPWPCSFLFAFSFSAKEKFDLEKWAEVYLVIEQDGTEVRKHIIIKLQLKEKEMTVENIIGAKTSMF